MAVTKIIDLEEQKEILFYQNAGTLEKQGHLLQTLYKISGKKEKKKKGKKRLRLNDWTEACQRKILTENRLTSPARRQILLTETMNIIILFSMSLNEKAGSRLGLVI